MMEFTAPQIVPRGFKRGRVESTGFHTKRPTDKKIIVISKATVNATDETTVLITATFPCTIQGLRWGVTVVQDGGTGNANFWWAIVILRDGLTQPTIVSSDGGTFYSPEQDCIVWETGIIDNNVHGMHFAGTTKSMRKLAGGDEIKFLVKGSATNTIKLIAVVQFFCKS